MINISAKQHANLESRVTHLETGFQEIRNGRQEISDKSDKIGRDILELSEISSIVSQYNEEVFEIERIENAFEACPCLRVLFDKIMKFISYCFGY